MSKVLLDKAASRLYSQIFLSLNFGPAASVGAYRSYLRISDLPSSLVKWTEITVSPSLAAWRLQKQERDRVVCE